MKMRPSDDIAELCCIYHDLIRVASRLYLFDDDELKNVIEWMKEDRSGLTEIELTAMIEFIKAFGDMYDEQT